MCNQEMFKLIKQELNNSNTILLINKSAILENYKIVKNKLGSNTKISMVLKNNSYGLGIEEVFKILQATDCVDFFVADYIEALQLREIANKVNPLRECNIYVFHSFLSSQLENFYQYRLTPVCNTLQEVIAYNEFAKKKNTKLNAILHIETGINRLALNELEVKEIAQDVEKYLSNLNIVHIMSHFACADLYQHSSIEKQYEKFEELIRILPKSTYSLSASYGIFVDEKYHYDMVRPAICIYGGNPTPYENNNPMKQVVYLYSKILQIKDLKDGDCYGYGHTWQSIGDSKLGIIPVGYADGVLRSSQELGFVYIDNIKVKIIGRVSMDLIAIDITNLDVKYQQVGQMVELMGDNISLDNFATNSKTIHCEILNVLTRRYKRLFYEGVNLGNNNGK